MDLFVLRHGKAEPSSDEPEDMKRALTAEGRNEIRKVARWMRSKKFGFNIIATSPLIRAHETAEIVARSLGQKDDSKSGRNLRQVAIRIHCAIMQHSLVNMLPSSSSGTNLRCRCLSAGSFPDLILPLSISQKEDWQKSGIIRSINGRPVNFNGCSRPGR